MTAEKRKRVVLIVLLSILSITVVQAYRNTRTSPAAAPEIATESSSSDVPASNEGRIRLDLIEKKPADTVGDSNLFQYRTRRSEPTGKVAAAPAPSAFTPPPVTEAPAVTRAPSPPPPPPISLKYQGFAIVGNGTLTAFLTDDVHRFNVTAGDVLMGRFRINRITTQSVEVEDLQFRRRQSLPLVQ